MKELSTEEKAKAYDEALKVLHKYDGANIMFSQSLKEEMFPELKESEDEEIKKEIISHLQYLAKYCTESMPNVDKWLAWLEKQSEQMSDTRYYILDKLIEADDIYQMSVNDAMVEEAKNKAIEVLSKLEISKLLGFEKQSGQKPQGKTALEAAKEEKVDNQNCVKLSDKVKPKFNVGDKIQYSKGCGTIMTIEKIENGEYVFANNMGNTTIENGNKWHLVEQNPVDKIEPKFKEEDWVVYENRVGIIVRILKEHYIISFDGVEEQVSFTINDRITKWTIQDAKDGDILSDGYSIVIFRGIGNEKWNDVIDYHIGLFTNSQRLVVQKSLSHWGRINEVTLYPATKEQRDLLFKKMKEVGYEWDAEKKELKKIEQKTAWSEEDDKKAERIIRLLYEAYDINCINGSIDWLRTLKSRVQPQKQEWSEEDEYYRNIILYCLNNESVGKADKENAIKWFESLRPQKQLKPNMAQLNALHSAIKQVDKGNADVLKGLYEKLKEL